MYSMHRSPQEWLDYGTPMSTTSDEASKLYDAALTQYISWYDDPALGGVSGCITKMLEADPNFVLGYAMKNGLAGMSVAKTTRTDAQFAKEVNDMVVLADKQSITDRERKHVNAVKLWTDGELTKAAAAWDDILCSYPQDMLAIKCSQFSHFYIGQQRPMRDVIAAVLSRWKPSMPLYGYLYGMYAFGLCETGLFDKAEVTAKKTILKILCHKKTFMEVDLIPACAVSGISLVEDDPWASHALTHVLDMGGRFDEGLQFLQGTENNWNVFGGITGHIYWHSALYNIEKGEYEEALGLFDNQLAKRKNDGFSMIGMYDACSLLYRLELEGVNVKDRWDSITDAHKSHLNEHVISFNDIHLLIGCLGSKDTVATEQLMDSLKDFVRNGKGDNQYISKEVGLPLCESFIAYDNQEYDKAVDLLYPIRYKLVSIGGSDAQRDIFDQFLIHAALKSTKKENQKKARFLLAERKASKDNSPLTDRLIETAMALHCD